MGGMTTPQWPQYSPDHDPTAPQQSPYALGLHWPGAFGHPHTARPDYTVRKDLPIGAWIVLTLVIAGALAGLIWHGVSPKPDVLEGAGGSFQLPADTDKNYFGAEAYYFLITAAAGLLSGVGAWVVGRRRGPVIAAALAVGAAAAGLVARAVGEAQTTNATLARSCGRDAGFDTICEVYDGHLQLRVAGLVLTWAITALAVFLTLSFFADKPPRAVAAATWQLPPPHIYGPQDYDWSVGSWPDPVNPTADRPPDPPPLPPPPWPPAAPATWPPPVQH